MQTLATDGHHFKIFYVIGNRFEKLVFHIKGETVGSKRKATNNIKI